jgi:Tol biopolymer transport system component
MRGTFAVAISVVVVASLLPGASSAGNYQPPPGDASPLWSPDGSRIAFLTTRGGGPALMVASADGTQERRILENLTAGGASLSPDWRWVAFVRFDDGRASLRVARLDRSDEREVLRAVSSTTVWSPDSRRLAFTTPEGLFVVDRDGSGLIRLAERGGAPTWSSDGSRIAYDGASPPGLYVVDSSGGVPRRIVSGVGSELNPMWSPDGRRIAFAAEVRQGSRRITTVRPDGSGRAAFPAVDTPYSTFTWMPDSRRLLVARNFDVDIVLLDLRTGKARRLARPAQMPAPSRDGRRIAFAAGGECRDRLGVYVASVDGKASTRITNDCRIFGTDGDDELRGTFLAEILLGLGGDDRLFASGAYYMGDTLAGGPGDDELVGEFRADLLRGGSGADLLQGGLSPDVLYGGPGVDRIDAGPGRDMVHAQDGERDVIVCGTNRAGLSERDKVWADAGDRVAADCEIVHRRPS